MASRFNSKGRRPPPRLAGSVRKQKPKPRERSGSLWQLLTPQRLIEYGRRNSLTPTRRKVRSFLELIPMAERCRLVLEKVPHARTDKELEQLLRFTRDNEFLQRYPYDLRQQLARALTFERFEIGDVVCNVGEAGSKMYIILKGRVSVHVPKRKITKKVTLSLAQRTAQRSAAAREVLQRDEDAKAEEERLRQEKEETARKAQEQAQREAEEALIPEWERAARNIVRQAEAASQETDPDRDGDQHKDAGGRGPRDGTGGEGGQDAEGAEHGAATGQGEAGEGEGEEGSENGSNGSGGGVTLKSIRMSMNEVAILESGASFGELSLLKGQPRAATIVAAEETDMMALHVDDYNRLLRAHDERILQEKVDFFCTLPFFQHLARQVVTTLSYFFTEERYPRNHVLIRQNDHLDHFYVIHTGTCKLMRQTQQITHKRFPMTHATRTTNVVEIAQLAAGESVGEYACLHDTSSDFTMVSTSSVVVYKCDYPHILPNLQSHSLEELRRLCEERHTFWHGRVPQVQEVAAALPITRAGRQPQATPRKATPPPIDEHHRQDDTLYLTDRLSSDLAKHVREGGPQATGRTRSSLAPRAPVALPARTSTASPRVRVARTNVGYERKGSPAPLATPPTTRPSTTGGLGSRGAQQEEHHHHHHHHHGGSVYSCRQGKGKGKGKGRRRGKKKKVHQFLHIGDGAFKRDFALHVQDTQRQVIDDETRRVPEWLLRYAPTPEEPEEPERDITLRRFEETKTDELSSRLETFLESTERRGLVKPVVKTPRWSRIAYTKGSAHPHANFLSLPEFKKIPATGRERLVPKSRIADLEGIALLQEQVKQHEEERTSRQVERAKRHAIHEAMKDPTASVIAAATGNKRAVGTGPSPGTGYRRRRGRKKAVPARDRVHAVNWGSFGEDTLRDREMMNGFPSASSGGDFRQVKDGQRTHARAWATYGRQVISPVQLVDMSHHDDSLIKEFLSNADAWH